MALKQRTATGKYVRIKDGKLYLSSDKDGANPFDEIEGTLVDLYFKDEEYEGTTQRKLYIVLNDSEDNYILGIRLDSLYGTTFLNFINNVDLSRPITLHPVSKEQKDATGKNTTRNSLLISQNGKFAKSYFTRDTPNGLPQMKKIKVSGKELWDKTDMLEFLENMVVNKIKPSLQGQVATKKTNIVEDTEDDAPFVNDSNTVDSEDAFPWEK